MEMKKTSDTQKTRLLTTPEIYGRDPAKSTAPKSQAYQMAVDMAARPAVYFHRDQEGSFSASGGPFDTP